MTKVTRQRVKRRGIKWYEHSVDIALAYPVVFGLNMSIMLFCKVSFNEVKKSGYPAFFH